ncbi:hypothetical protein MPTK1_4g02210 [Marchantia polymorpha subsp. ruderalis]|uniref:Uncharacterized protein n=2 Tax=Marchantia polymorpha TaxID=3197 RepID=A0AAF6B5F9_MARPO|nr:hypothetical protein MARPO_0080s0078 [Marchantia polymorpha]BBN07243.1 hypothetical protein Mp_4g02210 [Marchantia polymorpha subsp. ruderalis]|eukprot:PTQ34463.1 hypothetical protein MARPO_0080s0078 [Marchantia polymorpha]
MGPCRVDRQSSFLKSLSDIYVPKSRRRDFNNSLGILVLQRLENRGIKKNGVQRIADCYNELATEVQLQY